MRADLGCGSVGAQVRRQRLIGGGERCNHGGQRALEIDARIRGKLRQLQRFCPDRHDSVRDRRGVFPFGMGIAQFECVVRRRELMRTTGTLMSVMVERRAELIKRQQQHE